jgi:coenzyme F420 hydrogenase subunit beta
MSAPKVSFEESLEKGVIQAGKCVGCSTCVVVCPFNCLEYAVEEPKLVKECKICGICAQACPRYDWAWAKVENFVFGRERKPNEDFGVYRRMSLAQAKDKHVLDVCQDGGLVTALLLFALENGFIDGAVVSGLSREKPFHPIPLLATTREDILKSAGTKYSYSPNMQALAEGIKQKKSNLAFVGTPCQIQAVRKMQMAGLKRYVAPIKILIGLMCSECFYYEGLVQKHIQGKLGINPNDIKKMNIKGKMLVTTEKGVQAIPLSEIKQYARGSCKLCDDFSSELADISAGGLGLDKWTFTIIRTEKGEELFSMAEKTGILNIRSAEEEANTLNLLTKLSRKKREKSKTP